MAVAGDHFVEQAQVVGHLLRIRRVRRRAQHDAPASAALGANPLDQFRVIRQRLDVERHAIGDTALQPRLATRQPQRQREREVRTAV